MKRNLHALALFLVGAVFIGSSAMLVWQTMDYQSGESVYHEAAELVDLPDLSQPVPEAALPFESPLNPEDLVPEEPSSELIPEKEPGSEVQIDPYADALNDMDFTALRQVNEDVLGWILIPGTNLSYPVLQGDDNDYYLNHTWRKDRNSVGSIFLDYRCSGDFSDFHTVIYGHRMNNNSMFGQLHKFRDQAYLEAHPKVYITDDSGSRPYAIFSVYEADSMATYQMEFTDDTEKQAFLDYALSRSCVDAGVTPAPSDRIITMSTCTGNGHATRWVVHASLAE